MYHFCRVYRVHFKLFESETNMMELSTPGDVWIVRTPLINSVSEQVYEFKLRQRGIKWMLTLKTGSPRHWHKITNPRREKWYGTKWSERGTRLETVISLNGKGTKSNDWNRKMDGKSNIRNCTKKCREREIEWLGFHSISTLQTQWYIVSILTALHSMHCDTVCA